MQLAPLRAQPCSVRQVLLPAAAHVCGGAPAPPPPQAQQASQAKKPPRPASGNAQSKGIPSNDHLLFKSRHVQNSVPCKVTPQPLTSSPQLSQPTAPVARRVPESSNRQ